MEYEFVLTLNSVPAPDQKAVDALFEADCDDATLCYRLGRAYLDFSREASSFKEAVLSAIRDVKKAWPEAEVLCVDECDLVSQSDIARRIGRSRQQVYQYVNAERGPGDFPPPVYHLSEESPLWTWCSVAHWLRQNDMISEEVERQAWEVAIINNALELHNQRRFAPELADEVLQSIGDIY